MTNSLDETKKVKRVDINVGLLAELLINPGRKVYEVLPGGIPTTANLEVFAINPQKEETISVFLSDESFPEVERMVDAPVVDVVARKIQLCEKCEKG